MMKQHRLLNELSAIEQQLMQMLRGAHVIQAGQSQNATWNPPIDIYETPGEFILIAELPGVQGSEIDVKVVDGTLQLRGERRWVRESEDEQFHRIESSYGKFERNFSLSESIDTAGITADLDNGVLKVVLPKWPASVQNNLVGAVSGETATVKTPGSESPDSEGSGYQIPVRTDSD